MVAADPTHGVVFPLAPAPSLGVLGSEVESLLLGLGLLSLPDCLSSIVTLNYFNPESFVGPISSCCVRALACWRCGQRTATILVIAVLCSFL